MDFDKIDEGHPDYKPGEEPFHFFYNREERIARNNYNDCRSVAPDN